MPDPDFNWTGNYVRAKVRAMRVKVIQYAYEWGGPAEVAYLLRFDRSRYLAQEAKAAAARSPQARGGHRRWALHWRKQTRSCRSVIQEALWQRKRGTARA